MFMFFCSFAHFYFYLIFGNLIAYSIFHSFVNLNSFRLPGCFNSHKTIRSYLYFFFYSDSPARGFLHGFGYHDTDEIVEDSPPHEASHLQWKQVGEGAT